MCTDDLPDVCNFTTRGAEPVLSEAEQPGLCGPQALKPYVHTGTAHADTRSIPNKTVRLLAVLPHVHLALAEAMGFAHVHHNPSRQCTPTRGPPPTRSSAGPSGSRAIAQQFQILPILYLASAFFL